MLHETQTEECEGVLLLNLGLLLEKLPLSDWVVQLGVGVADFLLHDEELESLREAFLGSVPGTKQNTRVSSDLSATFPHDQNHGDEVLLTIWPTGS